MVTKCFVSPKCRNSKQQWIKTFKQIFGCLPRSFHFHLLVVRPSTSQLRFCLRNNLYNSQITARDVIVTDIEEADEQRCSVSDGKTFGRRVVDLWPIQNGFLHFSSVCSSFRLFFRAFLFAYLSGFVCVKSMG